VAARVLVVVVAAALAGPPLVLRGPVLRWLLARATASRCGSFALGGGHLAWSAVPHLIVGRPVSVVLTGLRITAPDGKPLLEAADLEIAVEVRALPLRLEVEHAWVAQGVWRLAIRADGGGSADAFRAVPAAGRAACLAPAPRRAPIAAAAPATGPARLVVRNLRLQEMNVDLDFPAWGLSLARGHATGSLSGGGGGPALLFDARGVVAAGGVLRIGTAGSPWATRAHFDAVDIPRVAVTPEAPTDLLLELRAATTGRARLSGRAEFQKIFPAPGPRVFGPPPPAGLALDARWDRIGDALVQLEAGWRQPQARIDRLNSDVTVSLHGPFDSLTGEVRARGRRVSLDVRIARSVYLDVGVVLDEFATQWFLDPALQPLFGGHVSGRLDAHARLAPSFAALSAEVYNTDLRLLRTRGGPAPRRLRFRVSRAVAGAAAAAEPEADTLDLALGRARLIDTRLVLEDLQVRWASLRAGGNVTIAFPPGAPGRPVPRTAVDSGFDVDITAIERWLPTEAVTGPLRFAVDARGPVDRMAIAVRFPPRAEIRVLRQRFAFPRALRATLLGGDEVDVPDLRVTHVGGGWAEARGHAVLDGLVTATLALGDYPVGALPGLDRIPVPAALAGGAPRPLAAVARGTLAANLDVRGQLASPTLSGRVTVAGAALANHELGDLRVDARISRDGEVVDTRLDGTIDPGVGFRAHVRRAGALSADATLTLHELALGPWLPPPLAGAPLSASGSATVAVDGATPARADATVTLAGPGLRGVEASARLRGAAADGRVRGEIDLGRWPVLWSRWLASASGVVDADVTLAADRRLAGHADVARDLMLRRRGWPAAVTVEAGGRLAVDGDTVETPGLTLRVPGARARLTGRAAVDPDELERTRLDLSISGRADAAMLAAQLRARVPELAAASGRVELEGHLGGTLAPPPGPSFAGQIRLADLALVPATTSTLPRLRASGVVQAEGTRLTSQDLKVALDGTGNLAIGRLGAPATVDIASLDPPRLGRIDLPVQGSGLTIGGPTSSLAISNLDADVRLAGQLDGELVLTGNVDLERGSYDPRRGPKTAHRGPPRKWFESLPPHLSIDLYVHGPRDALTVHVPVLWDVGLEFQCHAVANNKHGTLTGRLRGDGLYSRAAIALYDWFTPGDLRGCQIGAP
jgi:hypothetical protein